MVTLMGAVNRALPKISYMKALDIYLAFCFFMVFGALLEYATVSYTAKRINLHKRRFTEFKKKVEDLRTDLAKQRERNDQLVRIEDERAWEGHSDFCPLKMEQRKKMSRLSAQLAQDLAPSPQEEQASLHGEPPCPAVGTDCQRPPSLCLLMSANLQRLSLELGQGEIWETRLRS